MEKEFTSQDMIDFVNWFSDANVTEQEVQAYRDSVKIKAQREYQLYLELKAKYEK